LVHFSLIPLVVSQLFFFVDQYDVIGLIIYFQDWSGQDISSITSEICGFITVLSGTIILHMTREQEESNMQSTYIITYSFLSYSCQFPFVCGCIDRLLQLVGILLLQLNLSKWWYVLYLMQSPQDGSLVRIRWRMWRMNTSSLYTSQTILTVEFSYEVRLMEPIQQHELPMVIWCVASAVWIACPGV